MGTARIGIYFTRDRIRKQRREPKSMHTLIKRRTNAPVC